MHLETSKVKFNKPRGEVGCQVGLTIVREWGDTTCMVYPPVGCGLSAGDCVNTLIEVLVLKMSSSIERAKGVSGDACPSCPAKEVCEPYKAMQEYEASNEEC